ncbi:MAG: hypothetical protein R3232_00010 [Clostridia bacterium]|nr:hypothetical protein [Clostridia bacterium]
MLGIPDISIFLAYILCLASALLCLVYGIVMWNKGGGEDEIAEIEEEERWQEKENMIEEKL